MKLRVFKMKDGIEKNWDDVDFENECKTVTIIEGESNAECEEKAVENGYGDADIYGWNYDTI